MKMKSTKSALLMSFTSLLLCFAMLIGCTFAWFTDTATASVCQIQSGKLDVGLEMSSDGTTWVDAEGQQLEFKKAAGAPSTEAVLWEPGCTYELPAVRVVNNGNLALKYTIQITGVTGTATLLKAIEFTTASGSMTGTLLPGASSDAITLKGHMKEDAGNEYQGLTLDGIAITVYATQVEHEYDSINNTYDATADDMQPQGTPVASVGEVKVQKGEGGKVVTRAGETQTLENGNMKVTLPAGVELDTSAAGLAETPNYDKDEHDVEQSTGKTNVKMGFEFVDDQGSSSIQSVIAAAPEAEPVVGENDSIAYFDLKLPVAETNNTVLVKVEKDYIKGATVKAVYHNGDKLAPAASANANPTDESYFYAPTSGKLTLWVFHASPIDVIYEIPAAKIGDTMYDTLKAAIAAAPTNAYNGEATTIVLLKDTNGGYDIDKGRNIVLDLNNHTLTLGPAIGSPTTETNGMRVLYGNKLVLKNGTVKCSDILNDAGKKVKVGLANYDTAVLENVDLQSGSYVIRTINNAGNLTLRGNTTVADAQNADPTDNPTYTRAAIYNSPYWYAPAGFNSYLNVADGSVKVGSVCVNADSNDGDNDSGNWTGKAIINISAGTFGEFNVEGTKGLAEYNITGGTFDADPSAYVASGYEATQSGNVWTVVKAADHNGATIPAGAVYYPEAAKTFGVMVSEDGTYSNVTPLREGEAFPDLKPGDIYVYRGYQYCYHRGMSSLAGTSVWSNGQCSTCGACKDDHPGWSVVAIGTEASYGAIIPSINNAAVVAMMYTFAGNANLTEVPEIPESVICMAGAFSGCTGLADEQIVKPEHVTCTKYLR